MGLCPRKRREWKSDPDSFCLLIAANAPNEKCKGATGGPLGAADVNIAIQGQIAGDFEQSCRSHWQVALTASDKPDELLHASIPP